MRKPRELTVAEEREVSRLIATGRSAAWARQRVAENQFRRSPAQAVKAGGGGDGNPLIPSTDQRSESTGFHAPSNKRRSLEADAKVLQDQTNHGREDDV